MTDSKAVEMKTKSPGDVEAQPAADPPSPPESPSKVFWKKWGEAIVIVIGVIVWLAIYVTLLTISILQAESASFAPATHLNDPTASDEGWNTNVVKMPSGLYGPETINGVDQVNTTLRLEVKVSQFTPQSTGATATINLRLVLPESWMDQQNNPSTPLWSTSCSFGNAMITVTPKSTGAAAFDSTYNNFQVPTGTNLQYPFDIYRAAVTSSCYFYSDSNNKATISPPDNYLNYKVAIDSSDVGFFYKQVAFTQAGSQKVTLIYDDDAITGGGTPVNVTETFLVLPEFNWKFARTPISRVFPMYIIIAMWLVITAETLVFYPYYVSRKNVDAPGTVLGGVGILFALPNIRNTMPGAPQLGVIVDFAGYFWCLLIAISHLFIAAILWIRFTVVLPRAEEAKKAAEASKNK